MHDPARMRFVQGLGDLDSDLQRFLEGRRSPPQPVGQSFAFQMLHHQEADPVLRADIVQGADVRMIQRRNCPSLALHPLFEIEIVGEVCRQNLDGNIAPQPCIASAIHFAHAAGAERRQDFIGTELSARGQGHGCAQL